MAVEIEMAMDRGMGGGGFPQVSMSVCFDIVSSRRRNGRCGFSAYRFVEPTSVDLSGGIADHIHRRPVGVLARRSVGGCACDRAAAKRVSSNGISRRSASLILRSRRMPSIRPGILSRSTVSAASPAALIECRQLAI